MTFRQLSVVFGVVVLSVAVLLLGDTLWLRLLAIVGFTGVLTWALYSISAVLRAGEKMLSFRLRYHLEEGTALSAEWAEFLHNLAQESGHVVVTFLRDKKGRLHLFLEAHQIFETAAIQGLTDTAVLPGGECLRTRGHLAEVAMQRQEAYALVWPRSQAKSTASFSLPRWWPRGRKKGGAPETAAPVIVGEAIPAENATAATATWGQELLDKLCATAEGELRWHIFPQRQGLVVAGGTKQLLHGVRELPHANVRRIPPLVWHLPSALHPHIHRLAAFLRRLYWWFPLCAVWGEGGIACWLNLPPTAGHPRLDSEKVRLALPADYKPPEPLLVLGHDPQRQQPVGLSVAEGVPAHLAVLGGREAAAQLGLALVEQALGLGMGVVAVGDHFDGLGIIYSNLPEAKRGRVYRLSPLTENPLPIGLLTPKGGQPGDLGVSLHWLERFLAAEGVTLTAHRPAVQLCKALTGLGLADNPDFGLAELARLLNDPAAVRDELQRELEVLPDGVRAFVLGEGREMDNWALRSYATLLTQKLPLLRKLWVIRTITGPFANLHAVLAQGGAVFGSLPLRADPSSCQFARYMLHALLHTLELGPALVRPLMLYLEDFPLYLPATMDWGDLRRRNCFVVLNSGTGADRESLTKLCGADSSLFAPLLLQSGPEQSSETAEIFGLPREALSRLKGRMAVSRVPYAGNSLTCTINVLESAPPDGAEFYSAHGPKPLVEVEQELRLGEEESGGEEIQEAVEEEPVLLAGAAPAPVVPASAPGGEEAADIEGAAAGTMAAGSGVVPGRPQALAELYAGSEADDADVAVVPAGRLAALVRPLPEIDEVPEIDDDDTEPGAAITEVPALTPGLRVRSLEPTADAATGDGRDDVAPKGGAKSRRLPEPTEEGQALTHQELGLPDLPES